MHRRLALCAAVMLVHAWTASAGVQHYAFGLDQSLTYDILQGDQTIAVGVAPGPAGDIAFVTEQPFPIRISPSGVPADNVPPAAVTDLDISEVDRDSATLTWTAVGDDGLQGRATAYDLRYATFPITAATWQAATRATGEPLPKTAGQPESFTVGGLSPGITYYFALKVADDAYNWSALSNVASGSTEQAPIDDTAPAAITDLVAITKSTRSIALRWTSVGDEGNVGQASVYDLRYATTPINESSWNTAVQAQNEPIPRQAGQIELYLLTGLEPGTDYYIALKVADEVPNWSGLSNVVHERTPLALDGVPPGAVQDLRVSMSDTNSVTLTWTASGDDGYQGQAAAYDLRYDTDLITGETWATALQASGEGTPKEAGETESFRVTDLDPAMTYYFAIRVADEIPNWSGISNVASGAPQLPPPPDDLPPATVTTLEVNSETDSSVSLRWIAVGDDGNEGRASSYDVRYATFPIDPSNWEETTGCINEPTPKAAGQTETFNVAGLAAATTYYFALRVADEVPNWSELSNTTHATTYPILDMMAPPMISDLRAEHVLHRAILLVWTAPPDDEEAESVTAYDGRFSSIPIDEENWTEGIPIPGLPTPSAPGEIDSVLVDGLDPAEGYYLAIRAIDEAGNVAPISNVLAVTTTSAPDDLPPAQIVDFVAANSTTSTITLRWRAPADTIPEDCVDVPEVERYEIRRTTIPLDAEGWEMAIPVQAPDPATPGSLQELTVTDLLAETTYYFAIRAVDPRGNESEMSNVVTETTEPHEQPPDSVDPGSVVDLSASAPAYDRALLTWTAPGGDGSEGQADHYDIRRSFQALVGEAWEDATPILPPMPCKAAGEPERLLIGGLEPETTYYFAMRAVDEAGNEGPVSTSASTQTPAGPDTTAPPAVTNLTAIDTDTSSVLLQWTTPQDDRGRCARYDLRYATHGIDAANWESANRVEGLSAPNDPGAIDTFRVDGLPPGTRFSFALRSRDQADNLSAISNVAWATTDTLRGPDVPAQDTTPPAPIDDLIASPVRETQVLLTWTAVGDDGLRGTAATYELRHSAARIDSTNWDMATPISVPFVPASVGQVENMLVTELEPNRDHYFVVRASDEQGNLSACSGCAMAHTPEVPDTHAPSAPVGLVATSAGDRVLLHWTGSPDPDVADYILYRREVTPGSTETVAFLGIRGSEYEDSFVLPDVEYAYTVVARDGAGNISQKSTEVLLRTRLEDFLPEISGFDARCSVERPGERDGPRVHLTWTATAGSRFGGFIVERSMDEGSTWERRTVDLLKDQETYEHVETIEPGTYLYRVSAVSPRGYQRQFDPMVARWVEDLGRNEIDGPFPNPSLGVISLRFQLATETRTTVRLFDLSGRMIAVLCDEVTPAGQHSWSGEAIDGGGSPLSSGVYFLGIESGEEQIVRKLIVRR